jgi:hypothetical protein
LRKEKRKEGTKKGSLKNPNLPLYKKSGSHIEKLAPQIVQIPKGKEKPAARLGL